jgi:glutamate synthase domain-containing protein 3
MATAMGAQEYDFGKFLLVAQGCVMARICEKNTCPTGIATHDPKFKAKYKATKDHVVSALTLIADHVTEILADLEMESLDELVGRTDLIDLEPAQLETVIQRRFKMDYFMGERYVPKLPEKNLFISGTNDLNGRILDAAWRDGKQHEDNHLYFDIHNTDRGILSTLAGEMARALHEQRKTDPEAEGLPYGEKTLAFRGSAGQGFAAFLMAGTDVLLWGEANDSVAKSMSGGRVVIRPAKGSNFDAHENALIGNCALYGATGGKLYVNGRAGDRFAVRNSGALAVAEGAGLHACEYMTGGMVILLSGNARNIGAGMTGGVLYIFEDQKADINEEYLVEQPFDNEDEAEIREILADYVNATGSAYAQQILAEWSIRKVRLRKYLPIKWLAIQDKGKGAETVKTIGA